MSRTRPTLLLAAALLCGAALLQTALAVKANSGDYAWFDPLVEVRGLLRENFVHPVDDAAMRALRDVDALACVRCLHRA